ncbi:MAG: hypothetical protein QFC78_02385 [Pseudomonadota bacterium]|nr:hypothetical protein [Pseudomonadota bacterium]
MGIYEPLARHLGALDQDSWTTTFEQIESKLGFGLPPSARKYRQWWSNERGKGHSQKEGWQSVGWVTAEVDLAAEKIRFARKGGLGNLGASGQDAQSAALAELWHKASVLSGIFDRAELERAAVETFIRRTAIRELIAMGGTMPDFEPAPRERPFA